MNRTTPRLVVLVLGAVALGYLITVAVGQTPPPPAVGAPGDQADALPGQPRLVQPKKGGPGSAAPAVEWKKPILVVGKTAAAVYHSARVRDVGGRQFIVGVEAEKNLYTKGLFAKQTVWIPVDDVSQIVELDEIKKAEVEEKE